ncbi:hypothetical protein KQI63_05855 [bacterium]|nr:hypothetical protein [bacterium]
MGAQTTAERVTAVEVQLTDFRKETRAGQGRLEEKLDQLTHYIVGNGEPGLSEQVRRLQEKEQARAEREVEVVKTRRSRTWEIVMRVFTILAGLSATAIAISLGLPH